MKIFYHNDNDGRCAAFLFWKWLQREAIALRVDENNKEIEMNNAKVSQNDFIEIDYNWRFPREIISEGEAVYFLDFHPEKQEDYLWLCEHTDLIIVDHHKTTEQHINDMIRDYRGEKEPPSSHIIDIEVCGAMLVAKHFLGFTDETIPYFVKLVDDWDRWVLKGANSRLFNAGSRLHDTTPFSSFWSTLYDESNSNRVGFVVSIIEDGSILIKATAQNAQELCKSIGFETEFEGYKCFAINQSRCNSTWFDSVPDYDIHLNFYFNGTNWAVHLYSTTVDVSVIAKEHGGGGHIGAAGFVCNELPFKKTN